MGGHGHGGDGATEYRKKTVVMLSSVIQQSFSETFILSYLVNVIYSFYHGCSV